MADPREPLGRIVHDQRVARSAELRQPFYLSTWEDRDEGQRELDMRIGAAVAVRAVADAKLRNERLEAQVFALGAHMPAIREALELAVTVTDTDDRARARRYKAALEALGGTGETQERTDEEGPDHG